MKGTNLYLAVLRPNFRGLLLQVTYEANYNESHFGECEYIKSNIWTTGDHRSYEHHLSSVYKSCRDPSTMHWSLHDMLLYDDSSVISYRKRGDAQNANLHYQLRWQHQILVSHSPTDAAPSVSLIYPVSSVDLVKSELIRLTVSGHSHFLPWSDQSFHGAIVRSMLQFK